MRRSSQNYVCWQCLSLRPAERALLRQRTPPSTTAAFSILAPSSRSSRSSPSTLYRAIVDQRVRSVSTASRPAQDPAWDGSPRAKKLRAASQESLIRERLRQWEAENPAPALAVPDDRPTDGSVENTITKNWSEFNIRLDDSVQDDDAMQPHFDGVDMVDLSSNGSVVQAGDLIEVRYDRLSMPVIARLSCLSRRLTR